MKYAYPFLLVLLAASPTAAQAAPPPEPSSGDPRLLFSDTDYPPLAVKNNEQGTVQTELTVGTDGRVKACKILRSSNSVSLDTATCNILVARAKFKPARDSNGNAVEDTFVTPSITWRLAGNSSPAAAQISQVQPGLYFCSAPAGDYVRQDIVPLVQGQNLRLSVRLLKDNFHPKYAPAASVIFEIPNGDVRITVGEAQNDRRHLYVALQSAGAKVQEALFQYPLTNDWIIVELSLDKRGNLTLRSSNRTQRFSMGTTQITKTTLHCNSGEFQIDVWPLSYVPATAVPTPQPLK